MTECFAVLTMVFAFMSTTIYCVQVRRGKIRPVLATWVIFSVANILSLLSYFSDGSKPHTIVDAAANIVWAFASTISLVFVYRWHVGERRFEPAHLWCLGAAFVATLFWALSNDAFAANIAFQCVMVAAYVATCHRLWGAVENTEPVSAWLAGLAASMTGAVAPLLHGDTLGVIYNVRGIVCTLAALFLMLRLKIRNGRFESTR